MSKVSNIVKVAAVGALDVGAVKILSEKITDPKKYYGACAALGVASGVAASFLIKDDDDEEPKKKLKGKKDESKKHDKKSKNANKKEADEDEDEEDAEDVESEDDHSDAKADKGDDEEEDDEDEEEEEERRSQRTAYENIVRQRGYSTPDNDPDEDSEIVSYDVSYDEYPMDLDIDGIDELEEEDTGCYEVDFNTYATYKGSTARLKYSCYNGTLYDTDGEAYYDTQPDFYDIVRNFVNTRYSSKNDIVCIFDKSADTMYAVHVYPDQSCFDD